MVLYELILTIKDTASFGVLNWTVHNISMAVVKDGGVVRSIQNHGIRQLPHRIKTKTLPDRGGPRYFDNARIVSVYYDGNPNTIKSVQNEMVFNTDIIRRVTVQARNPLWFVNISKENKNPYIQMVKAKEEEEAAAAAAAEEEDDEDEANQDVTFDTMETRENKSTSVVDDVLNVNALKMNGSNTETVVVVQEEGEVDVDVASKEGTAAETTVTMSNVVPPESTDDANK